MWVQRGLTAGLLLFAAVSLTVVAVDLLREPTGQGGEPIESSTASKAVVTFFHGTTRCLACNGIAAATRAELDAGFADELGRGDVVWRVIDYEAPGQGGYVQRYGLYGAVIVVADGRAPARWKRLDGVWTHVDDPAALRAYVRRELSTFLAGSGP